nr:hypothetical protein [Tanacetum cinerariifolium]
PDLSQRSPQNCPKCGNPVDGQYCQGCALLRKKVKEDLFHIVVKMEFSKILSSHPMTIPTLLMLFKSQSLSIKTPMKIPHKVLHKSTTIVVTGIPVCYDDDEDYTIAITQKEPDNSLSMGDEHLDTISATESDEFIKSSVENLVPNPNIPKKIYSNPLFNEEIISMKIDPHQFNAKSDLIESLLDRDSLIISSSSKIDSLFDEFAGELTLLKSIPPGINDTKCDPEEDIRLIKRLLYDNSSPLPL